MINPRLPREVGDFAFFLVFSLWLEMLFIRLLALTLNPSPKNGRGTFKLAPLLPKMGEGVGG
ncbi:hypothetical protein CDG76_24960 [Nostoc sp. 'Peltigera membranacea cyanobiont' 210A]|nr:hypothetical protein CDG76_24960 [Nostoc sp. 'Peltigera membranacea cyanobiont' 210A]